MLNEKEIMKLILEFIPVEERLPEIPANLPGYLPYVKVIGIWDVGNGKKNWAEFYFYERVIRGKIVRRFEWNDRIDPFKVTHWAYVNVN